jgi:NTE family protein
MHQSLLLALLFALAAGSAAAQTIPSTDTAPSLPSTATPQVAARPKVGLALGGGAARGIAHIGLLRWF